MPRADASLDELIKTWEQVEEYWKVMNDSLTVLPYPLVEAKFKMSVFKTTLIQKNLKIPFSFGSV